MGRRRMGNDAAKEAVGGGGMDRYGIKGFGIYGLRIVDYAALPIIQINQCLCSKLGMEVLGAFYENLKSRDRGVKGGGGTHSTVVV